MEQYISRNNIPSCFARWGSKENSPVLWNECIVSLMPESSVSMRDRKSHNNLPLSLWREYNKYNKIHIVAILFLMLATFSNSLKDISQEATEGGRGREKLGKWRKIGNHYIQRKENVDYPSLLLLDFMVFCPTKGSQDLKSLNRLFLPFLIQDYYHNMDGEKFWVVVGHDQRSNLSFL